MQDSGALDQGTILNKNKIVTRSKVPFIGSRMFKSVNSFYYPIGLSLANYQLLYYSIHSFKIDIFSIIASLVPDATNTVILTQSETTTVAGQAKRRIHLIGELNKDGLELPAAQKPYVNRDYPAFVGGSGGGIVSINFGRTIFYGGLYYPEIYIQMANDVSSLGGTLIGSVNVEDFGEIPMYRNSGFEGVCIGSILIKERYDSSFGVKNGGSVTIRNLGSETNDFITEIDNIYLNNKQCDFTVRNGEVLVSIPEGTRSGSLLAESLGRYNYYRFPFIVKI